jgi:hypothetical protein
MTWLTPDFENIPDELTSLDRWVVWRNKVPYCATSQRKASSTNPSTWSSFLNCKTAHAVGKFDGVGFVLNDDGIVGLDLDDCVHDGKPSSKALALLNKVNTQYIEISPSGTGLRAFGYGELPRGRKGTIDGLRVEIYGNARYLTITGHALKIGKLTPLIGLQDLITSFDTPTEDTEATEDTEFNSSVSSVSSVGIEMNWPTQVVPKKYGQRNSCLFELCRRLKSVEPDASILRQMEVVKKWHADHIHNIKTKDLAITWADWQNAWSKVKSPYGERLEKCLANMVDCDLPPGLSNLGEKGIRLYKICVALQQDQSDGRPFFLSARTAGLLLGIHFTDAASLLSAFVSNSWIELVTAGSGNRASRYRMTPRNPKEKPRGDSDVP